MTVSYVPRECGEIFANVSYHFFGASPVLSTGHIDRQITPGSVQPFDMGFVLFLLTRHGCLAKSGNWHKLRSCGRVCANQSAAVTSCGALPKFASTFPVLAAARAAHFPPAISFLRLSFQTCPFQPSVSREMHVLHSTGSFCLAVKAVGFWGTGFWPVARPGLEHF